MPSDVPHYPFQIVGTDLFHWPKDFLLVVDYYNRYLETEKLYKTCSNNNKEDQECVFKEIPEIVISDNSPQYHSREFKKFPKDWGFQHVKRSSEYPISNGLAEKIVQTAKKLLEKTKENKKDQPKLLAEDNFDQFYQLIQTI